MTTHVRQRQPPAAGRSEPMIKVVLFDFGGVLAEEGFREGLKAIAWSNGLDPESFFRDATEAVYNTGYVLGTVRENVFWSELRERMGIRGEDAELRWEILQRFTLRPRILDIVRMLRARGFILAILSDQSQWLDELDAQYHFFQLFDRVFNSYHLGKGKRDASIFIDVVRALGVKPDEALFIDDNEGHVDRARSQGLRAILYTAESSFESEMRDLGLM
jgi:putative hydrolase of the HAD superfamily